MNDALRESLLITIEKIYLLCSAAYHLIMASLYWVLIKILKGYRWFLINLLEYLESREEGDMAK